MIFNPHILLVDDDAMVRDILTEYLTSFGYTNVVAMKDGNSAVKYLKNNRHRVDLIISDWEMPNGGGFHLLQAVRRSTDRQNTLFMMVTSQRSQERVKITRAALWKVDAYLVKPFRGDVLRDKIEALLVEHTGKKAA